VIVLVCGRPGPLNSCAFADTTPKAPYPPADCPEPAPKVFANNASGPVDQVEPLYSLEKNGFGLFPALQ